jgi:catechol 2,3-dioxygenase-like lactoylglutathione lyase family enzyme
MRMLHAIPALPVFEMARSITFYRDKLGFRLVHQDSGFAIVQRDVVTLHLWEASDQSWRSRSAANSVVSGAESFIAGTASCRIAVDDVDALHHELEPLGLLHPKGQLRDQPWGSREFAITDPDNNLITFFMRL